MSSPRIVAMSLPWPGVVRAFSEGTRAGLWRHVVLDPKRNWSIPEADLYLIADGYQEFYEPLIPELKKRFDCKLGFYYNSTLLQSDMSKQEIHLACRTFDFLEQGKVDFIVFLSKSWWNVFRHPRMYYLPHAIGLLPEAAARRTGSGAVKNVGLFLSTTHRKNIAHQLVALKGRQDVVLHTNVEGHYPELIRHLGIRRKAYPWLGPKRLAKAFSRMDLALQVTHLEVESFCYGALDSLMLGVPTLVSRTIAENFRLRRPELIVRDPSDVAEIRAKVDRLLDLGARERAELSRRCFEHVRALAERNNREIARGLRRLWRDLNG